MGSSISKVKRNISNQEENNDRFPIHSVEEPHVRALTRSKNVSDTQLLDDIVIGSRHRDQVEISSSSEEEKATNNNELILHKQGNFQQPHLQQYNEQLRVQRIDNIRRTNKKKHPIVEISSSSSSPSSSPSKSSSFENETASPQVSFNHKYKENQQPLSSLFSSSNYTNSDFNNDPGDNDDSEEEDVYDWLQTNSTQFSNKTTPSTTTENSTPNQSFSSPFRSPKVKEKITFTPPGWDSPLHRGSSFRSTYRQNMNVKERPILVKDTHTVERKNAQLPKMKPEVTKGNWLTNRLVVNNYIILQCVGRGSYGEVRLCKNKNSNNLFAVKVINRTKARISLGALDDLRMEVAIMKKLRHENCVSLYEVMDGALYI